MIKTYDHKGNLTKQRQLTYTPDGQIQSIKDKDSKQQERLIATYAYNHLRQRIAKTTYHKDNQTNQTKEDTTYYLWDKGLLSAEIKNNKVTAKPQLTRRYIYLDITPVAVLDYDYNDKGKIKNTQVYSIHTDHLGTPKAITNDKQETVWQIDLDTFGEVKQIQSKNNFTFNLRFAGQYHDNETGYYYNYHRYYNPQTGRYLTSDPIGLNGGSLNTYAYVDNESWNAIDPYGLMRIYNVPNNGGGNGYESRYQFNFDPIIGKTFDEAVSLWSRAINRLGKLSDGVTYMMYPKPYQSHKTIASDPKGWFDCGNFDSTLVGEYEAMFPGKEHSNSMYRLTRAEAEKFLNAMRKKYPTQMNNFYPGTTKSILNTADQYAREHWYNKTFNIKIEVVK